MTTVFIILSILFLLLTARVSLGFSEIRAFSIQTKALVQDIIADRKHEHGGFRCFFQDSIIPRMPEDVLKALTEEHRRYCIRYMLETPQFYNGASFTNSDIGCESENTFSIKNGELFVDGMPALEFFKTLPEVDHRLACSAAFAKWHEAYLRALAAQYFNLNNQA